MDLQQGVGESVRVAEMTWRMVETYLERDDRCIVPLGCTEQHAHISLATDSILAERVSVEAAEPLDVPVFPVISYGITPFFMGYPGTVSLSPTTYERVLLEVLGSVKRHGFRRILVVNGHGGNKPARPAVEAWADRKRDVELRWHDWWAAPDVRAVIDEVDPHASHASWMETFPWTRVPGVELPRERKPPVDLSGIQDISLADYRERLGDGSFGGWYERSDAVMERVWKTAVEETRAVLERDGWGRE